MRQGVAVPRGARDQRRVRAPTARSAGCDLRGGRPTPQLAEIDARLTPEVRAVLSVRRCASGALGRRRHRPGRGSPSSWPRWPTSSTSRSPGRTATSVSGPRPGSVCRAAARRPALTSRRGCSARGSSRPSAGRAGGRAAHRGRGLRGRRRPGLARLPGRDAAQRGDVRAARTPVLLLHLRHALVRQRRVRGRRRRHRGPAAGRRGGRGRSTPRAPGGRRPAACATSPAVRPGWPAASGSTAPPTASTCCDPASPVRLTCVRAPAPGRRRQPGRGSASPPRAERPWRFWLAGEPTVSATARPDAVGAPCRPPGRLVP